MKHTHLKYKRPDASKSAVDYIVAIMFPLNKSQLFITVILVTFDHFLPGWLILPVSSLFALPLLLKLEDLFNIGESIRCSHGQLIMAS